MISMHFTDVSRVISPASCSNERQRSLQQTASTHLWYQNFGREFVDITRVKLLLEEVLKICSVPQEADK